MWLAFRLVLVSLGVTGASLAVSQAPVVLTPVVNFSRSADSSYFLTANGSLVGTRGGNTVKVRFSGSHPAWLYQVAQKPENWSGTGMAVMSLTNYESFPVTVCVIISSSSNPADLSSSFQAPVTLGAGQTSRFGFAYDLPDPTQQGLKVLPPPAGDPLSYVYSKSQLNPTQVGHWRLSYQGTAAATIGLNEFDIASYTAGFPHMVDQWFQWDWRNWTDKIHSSSDFQLRLAAEKADLAANPGTGEVNGSLGLPNQGPSGNWKVGSRNGKKYLVHPNGRLFWMFGLNGVSDAYGTMVSNRTQMFDALPDASGPYKALYVNHQASYGPSGVDFLEQRYNLMQKYGSSYLAPFVSVLKQSLPSWGFNTVGAWSFDNVNDGSMPFTVELSTNSFPTRLTTANLNWTTLPDPYDNSFEGWMAQSFNKSLATYESKPNFAGVFVDNEMSWGTVSSTDAAGTDSCALGALAASAKQPARIAFLSQLRSEYGTIRALNSAWGASFSSFNAMTAPSNGALGLNAAAIRDCTTFERAFALTYFEKVKAALEGAGLRSLYLGCRFSTFNDAVVGAASQVVDVLSFNHYGTVDTYPWSYFNGLPKPVLLSETSVGENNEGTFGGNPLAPDSEQRAEWAYAILTTAAKQPNVVGVDWFNYTDWAATGDGDSMANYGYGVVDVCDTPRYPLVSAFRAFAKQLYALRG